MWKWVVKALLALTENPAVRQWARRQAVRVVNGIRQRAEKRIGMLYDAAGLDPLPKPKVSRLIRTQSDILKPGQVAVVDGRAYRVTRLLSSNVRETVYEAVEA